MSGRRRFKNVFLELENIFHVLIGDERLARSNGALSQQYVFELALRRRQNAGALVDLRRVKQVKHTEVLHLQNFVHTFEAQ